LLYPFGTWYGVAPRGPVSYAFWWGVGNATGFPVAIEASVHFYGPLEDDFRCKLGDPCHLPIRGHGIAQENRVMLFPAPHSCGTTAPTRLEGLVSPAPFDAHGTTALLGVPRAIRIGGDLVASGEYTVCWRGEVSVTATGAPLASGYDIFIGRLTIVTQELPFDCQIGTRYGKYADPAWCPIDTDAVAQLAAPPAP
jgi:hypothetical protein